MELDSTTHRTPMKKRSLSSHQFNNDVFSCTILAQVQSEVKVGVGKVSEHSSKLEPMSWFQL
jgi:hypothetical protein